MSACIHTDLFVCLFACMCAYIGVFVYAYTCILYVYMYIHMYMCAHILMCRCNNMLLLSSPVILGAACFVFSEVLAGAE